MTFRITTRRNEAVIAEHTAPNLDAAHLHILTDGLPATMQIRAAAKLLQQVTDEGGVIELPGEIEITVEALA